MVAEVEETQTYSDMRNTLPWRMLGIRQCITTDNASLNTERTNTVF